MAIDLNPLNAYLPTPLGVDLDTCIEAARPYIPSCIELYATFVSTGDYALVNAIYDYYIANSDLEITLYELTTVKLVESIEGEKTTNYVVQKDDEIKKLTEEEFNTATTVVNNSYLSFLGDSIANLIEGTKYLFNEVMNEIKEFFGFNISVNTDWVPIVTKGNAFKYKVKQDYQIRTDKTVEYKANAVNKSKKSQIKTVEYETDYIATVMDENGILRNETITETKNARYYVETSVCVDHKISTWTNKLQYVSNNIIEYDEDNRFLQIFVKMIEENDYKYTVDDVAIAVEIIEAYYGESYMSVGSSIDYSALPDGEFGWPVPANKVVSALFGYTTWYGDNHNGIDIWAADESGNPTASFSYVGKVDVVAAQDGKVIKAFNGNCADGNRVSSSCGNTYGNHIIIQHDNNYVTVYAHLASGSIAVNVGEEVTAGQYLGKMGSSGNSSGTHLHFEIRFDNTRVDPLAFYDVEPYNYAVPYESRNKLEITMVNPYKVNFSI